MKGLLFPPETGSSAASELEGRYPSAVCAPTAISRTFPTTGWAKLVDENAGSLNLDFTMGSMMLYFIARKESDGLPSQNMRSVSSRICGLYKGGYCREVEVMKTVETGTALELYLRCFCKAEMKTRERYRLEMVLSSSDVGSKINSITFASCMCKAGQAPRASCKHVAAVCYGLEESCRRGIFVGSTCSTSDLQRWNAPPAKCLCKD